MRHFSVLKILNLSCLIPVFKVEKSRIYRELGVHYFTKLVTIYMQYVCNNM